MANYDERLARYASEFTTSKGNNADKPNYYDLPQGTLKARILPGMDPNNPDRDFFCKTILHYSVSPGNAKIPVICGKAKNNLAYCHVCKRMNELNATGNAADKAIAEKLKPVYRYYIALIPREGPKMGEVVIYPARKVILNKVIGILKNPDYGDITDLNTGRDVTFTRTGSMRETEYDVLPKPNQTPAGPNIAEIQSSLPFLYRFAEAPDQDEVAALMRGDVQYLKTGGMALNWSPAGVKIDKAIQEDTTEEEEFVPPPTPPPSAKREKSAAIRKILDDDEA